MYHHKVNELQEFFFEAMVAGWAGNGQKHTIPALPGNRAIEFKKSNFRLLDCYGVNRHKSAGWTKIWHNEAQVFFMSYCGIYPSDIEFVKRALLATYTAKQFVGGRGPVHYTEADLIYRNNVQRPEIVRFSGTESVSSQSGVLLGYHDYMGMLMIP